VRPDCKKLDLWLHDHDPPSALPCKVGDRSAIGGLATADVTELVEEALAAIHFESANTLPLSMRTACMGAWEVRIWAFGLSLQGMMSSACSLATMAPPASVFLSFTASRRTPLLCLGRRSSATSYFFRVLAFALRLQLIFSQG
jgi:hypothetical protein